MPSQRIIVVGGVAAGPAAAAEAKRVDPAAEVILFEQGGDISYGACEMPYLLGGDIERSGDLVVHDAQDLRESRGVEVHTLHRVEAVDLRSRRVLVKDLVRGLERRERFDKLILATGATVRWPAIEGLEGDRVHAFRTLDDADRVHALSKSGSARWVIIGGGFTGLEVAHQLNLAGHRVTVLAPSGPLASRLDTPMQSLVESALVAAGVGIRRTRATGVRHGAPGAPIAIRTDDGELVGADQVVVATGTMPNSELAQAAGLKLGPTGGIRTDSRMRTSNTVVWACGDCIEVTHLVTGESVSVPLSPVAFRTGRVAGRNAARKGRLGPAEFSGTVAAFGIKVGGLEVASVGISSAEARRLGIETIVADARQGSRARHMPGREPVDVRLVVERKTRRILGGQLAGRDGAALRVNPLVPLLRARSTVDDLYEQDLMYTPPFSPSLDPLLVAARVAQKALDR